MMTGIGELWDISIEKPYGQGLESYEQYALFNVIGLSFRLRRRLDI
jgi:hypothetical protein